MKLMWNLFAHNRLSSVNLPRELKKKSLRNTQQLPFS